MDERLKPVVLTESEIIIVGSVCVQRYAQNLTNGKREMYGAEDYRGFQYMVDGAFGEMAVAKWLGLYWNGAIGNLTAADVGNIQVRATRSNPPELILHPRDKDEDVFVLVGLERNQALIFGWCLGFEGKDECYWEDRHGKGRPAYFIPLDADPIREFDETWDRMVSRLTTVDAVKGASHGGTVSKPYA